MYCGTCGNKVHSGDAFCEFCGASLVAHSRIAPVAFRHPQRGIIFDRRTVAILAVFFVAMAVLVGVSKFMGGGPAAAQPISVPAEITPTLPATMPAEVTPVPDAGTKAISTTAAATLTPPQSPAVVVVFDNPVVEAWIRANYITKQGPITTDDMAGITTFEYDAINDKDATGTLSSLDDLRHCINLQSLHVSRQPVTSIEWMRNLQHLASVKLIDCAVSDISPLVAILTLQEVWISGCPVTDAEPVLWLPNIRQINAMRTNISDITPLRCSHGLVGFHCENKLRDYTPLCDHPNMKDLTLSGLSNDDFEAILGTMKGLDTFRIRNSTIEDSSLFLFRGRSMAGLSLNNCGLTDISELSNLFAVSDLRLADNRIEDISPLAGLTMIDCCLDLSNNNIRDYYPLRNMKALRALYVTGNPVTDNETLRELEKNGCKVYR